MHDQLRQALRRAASTTSDFDLSPDIVLPENRRLKPAAVLILLTQSRDQSYVTLTKRSSALKNHPGQISFPGGKMDEADQNLQDTALREADEEIGLPRHLVEILGALPKHETVTGFDIQPFLGIATGDFELRCDPNEVAEVFTVPFAFLLTKAHYKIEKRRWLGDDRAYYTIPYGPYYIWGATARILHSLATVLAR